MQRSSETIGAIAAALAKAQAELTNPEKARAGHRAQGVGRARDRDGSDDSNRRMGGVRTCWRPVLNQAFACEDRAADAASNVVLRNP